MTQDPKERKSTNRDIEEMLQLPPVEFKSKFYLECYSDLTYNDKGNALFHKLMHKSLEKSHARRNFKKVLEIGARNLEHFHYIKHDFESFTLTDIDDLSNELPGWKLTNRKIDFIQDDISSSRLASNEFERVIITCVLHHVRGMESALMEIRRIAKSGGIIDILLPCDPGIIYRTLKQFGPYRRARKEGYLKIKKIMDARDHINHFLGILELIKFVFRNDKVKICMFPFSFLPYDFNLWATIRIIKT